MHILNLVPSKSIHKTPIELWIGRKPSMKNLHIWGCPTHMLKGKPNKLEPKSEVCLFVCYPKETRGYLFYSHTDNKVFASTNAKFLVNDYVNNFTPRSRVVSAKMTEPVIEQSIDETRKDMMLLVKQQRKFFGSRNSFLVLVLSEWSKFQSHCSMTIVEQLHNPRIQRIVRKESL